jgi:hypothetical protein
MMRATSTLLILIASSAMLSAMDDASLSGKAYKSDAPDGRFSVQAHQEKGWGKFDVEIIDLASGETALSFDPEARFIGAAWSPDGKFVAIEQNRTSHDSAVSVFSMGKEKVQRVILPKDCSYEDESAAVFEASTRKHAQIDKSQGFHIAMAAFQVGKWIDSDTLVLGASGRGWWGGEVAGDKDRRFMADYQLTLHIAADGTSTVKEITLKNYEAL